MGRPKGAAVVLHTAPAFSFGHSSAAGKTVDEAGPGPGAYCPKGAASSSSLSCKGGGFGTSGRLAPYGNQNPAPGEYNVSLKVTHKRALAASLQGRESHDPLKQQQPGPGQYPEVPAAITHPAPPAVSISHRLQGSREAERRPAPGEYHPELFRSTSPLPVTMKHKRGLAAGDRPDSGHAVPGPGAYRPQDVTVNSHGSPVHTIAGRQRPSSCAASLPGPADYSPYLQGARRPASFSQAERYPASHYEVRPSPGSYFTHSVVQRQAGHCVESLRRSAPSLTIGVRQPASAAGSGNPGPGDYGVPKDSLLRSSSPCFTFKGVAAKDHLSRNPAPGAYSPERHTAAVSKHVNPPAVSISHRCPPPTSHDRQPGPGEYNASDFRSTSQLPVTIKHKRGLAAGDRPDSGHAVPGPGEYKLPSSIGKHGITMGAKLKGAAAADGVPGPGEYDVHGSTLGVAGLS
ncbi:hypothetical protein OEZ85_013245 [Tetradesmus obliquus]|uniref:Uncharacterized protein n=1 Tax=Tetradesmus obliquus TaxID=3088 RepID=A0ABY8U5G5_TETOB|nr:hypothetical protein OEZ85_013245 [Tetradesmus obliquus]